MLKVSENRPKMALGDFLARVDAAFRREEKALRLMGPFDRTRVFVLGDDWEFTQSIEDIWTDIQEDIRLRGRIPMPFPDIACVSWIRPDTPPNRLLGEENLVIKEPDWVLDRIMEVPKEEIDRLIPEFLDIPNLGDEKVVQWFAIVRIHGLYPKAIPWFGGFCQVIEDGRVKVAAPEGLSQELATICRQVAAISHPMNYVVRVEPELTPHEARRVASGKRYPAAKRPHYIVIDHEVLVDLRRQASGGTHAPPVPHERRGHWRRLAERCRKARSQGKDRTWVRPAWVGDPEFVVGRNRYVVLDFKKG